METSRQSRKRIWLAWEHHRRNVSMSEMLNAELHEIEVTGGRLRRYLRSIKRTVRLLRDERPEVLLVQNPSLVLALLATWLGPRLGSSVFVDSHNAGVFPPIAPGWLSRSLARRIARRAECTFVSNESLVRVIERYGGRAVAVPDPLPELEPPDPVTPEPTFTTLFICTWADDEPYLAVIDAARRVPDVRIRITGRRSTFEKRHPNVALPDNVELTDFLPEADFVASLFTADVIMDLTTRDDCLVCGAYEAVSAGTPLILSDTAINRAYFNKGAQYCDNTTQGIAQAITEAQQGIGQLRDQVSDLRVELTTKQGALAQELEQVLDGGNGETPASGPA